MLPNIKPKAETFVRVILTIVVLFNAVLPTPALAMPPGAEGESSVQSEPHQNIFAQSSARVGSGFSVSVPENVKDDKFAAQIILDTLTPEPVFTPTPDLLSTSMPASVSVDDKLPVLFDFSASPAQANPGDDVIFTVIITNNGKAEIRGLMFSNLLPDQLKKPKSKNNDFKFDPKTNILTWTADSKKDNGAVILAGETITLQYTATIDSQIDKDLQVVDEADLFMDGAVSPLTATLELGIFPQGKEKEFTSLGSQGGKAEGVEGLVSLDVPAGELSGTDGILIEDLSESFQPDSSVPLLVFQLDVVSQNQENVTPVISPETPTVTPLVVASTVEPLSTATLSETAIVTVTPAISTPTAESLAINQPVLSPEAPEQQALTGITETVSSDSTEEVSIKSTAETPSDMDLTPTSTITPTPTVEPSPTLTITPTITLPPTIVVKETPTPILVSQEQDRITSLKPEETKFENPVVLTISLDGLVELATLGADQTPFLMTLDESSGYWVRMPLKSIDRKAGTITAEITHFSTWGVGVGPTFPQNGASILLFDQAYPDLFTGRSKYSIPLWTPPGRNGMAPSLALSYSSGKVDGILGNVQSPWAGMGWNVDTVEIARKITSCLGCSPQISFGYENKFLLLFNGTGYELIPDGVTPGRYHTKAESFLYIQLHNDSLGNNSPAAPNTTGEWWEVVERDGTRWRLGWNNGAEQRAPMPGYPGAATGVWASLGYAGHALDVVAYRWRADQGTDTHGNRMTFTYFEESLEFMVNVLYDRASYVDMITYTTHTSGSPAPGYSVAFVREARMAPDLPPVAGLGDNGDSYRLDRIDIKYGANVVRTYDLGYALRSYSDDGKSWVALTLTSLSINGGGTSLPTMLFTYTDKDNRANCGTGCQEWAYPRLASISNGWGGITTYAYGNDGPSRPTNTWYNWRTETLDIADGVNANPMKTTFAYGTACYNDATAGWCNPSNVGELIGYSQTTATTKDFNGTTSLAIAVHKFHTDQQKAGREYEVQNQDGSGTIVSQMNTTYTVVTSGFPTGGYFTYASAMEEFLRAGSLARVNRMEYTYNAATGNLTNEKQYNGTPTLYRQTDYEYVTNTSLSVWILDTLARRTLKDSGGTTLAKQEYGYDDSLPGSGSPTVGELTLSRIVDGSQTIDTSYVYDAYGNLTDTYLYKSYGASGTLPSGAVLLFSTGYETTLKTYATSSANPLSQTTVTGYDFGLGLPTTITDSNGNTTTTAYDGLGRVTSVTYPGSAQPNVKYVYPAPTGAPFGLKMEIWDVTASVYRAAWQMLDGLGRVLQTQGPYETAGYLVITDTSYNAQGMSYYQGLPRTLSGTGGVYFAPSWGSVPHTTNSYDALGRTTSIAYPGSSPESFSYSGLRTTAVDRNNHQEVQERDAFGRLVKVEEYTGSGTYSLYATTTYEYDPRDLLKKVTDTAGTQTSIIYNGFGRKTSMADPDMGSWSYGYDVLGNLASQTDARNCVTSVTYDNLNRPIQKTYSGPGACATTPPVTYTYDSTTGGNEGIGRRTGMTDGSGSTSWFYNVLGQATNETRSIESTNYSLGFTFDAFSRPLTQTLPNGEALTFSYNAMGQLSGMSGTSAYLSQVHYNAGGQVTDQQLGNGLRQQSCYESNTLRLSGLRVYSGALQACGTGPSSPRLNLSYTYQSNGNVSQLIDSTRGETLSFTYDDLDRLLSVSGPYNQGYGYNSIGNLTSKGSASSSDTLSAFVSVTSGFNHSCGLTSAGGVKCWGSNTQGQLGDGTWTSRFTPVMVSGLSSGVTAIAAGQYHTCALTAAGGMKCWGSNYEGVLGDGTITNRNTPVNVSGLNSGVAAISLGNSNSCALTTGGGVKCWGYNGDGRVGDGTTVSVRLTPVNVSGLTSGVSSISAGARHTCAVTTSGGAKCWGYNWYGALGDGTTTTPLIPVNVSGLTSGVASISAGGEHTCARMTSGGVKCWGYNSSGQVGDGTTTQRLTPVDVSGLISGVAAISLGSSHSCALTTSGGMKCWGMNNVGQLGDGSIIQRLTPVNVSGLTSGVALMASGWNHSCALTTSGWVKCWGENSTFGRLGDGTTLQRTTAINVSGLTNGGSPLDAGGFHTCGLTSSGGLKCWGHNFYGQLGDGTTTHRSTPVNVSGLSSGVIAVSAGYTNTCALTTNGGVKCWGYNGDGRVGDGTTVSPRLTPVDVSGLTSGVIAISAGTSHSCALTASGGVKCWGYNTQGQLGDGTTAQRLTPVDVSGLTSGVIAISAGEYHTCALTANGGVKCWGWNTSGQLGDGTATQRLTPVDVSGLTSGVTAISAGNFHTCALTTGGGLKCWGNNGSGQLGDGTTTQRLSPVDVNGLSSGATAVAAGISQTCAQTAGGGMKCWGYNADGRLGDGTTIQRTTPIDVSGLSGGNVLAVTTGFNHSCARAGVDQKCWGDNAYGQVGDGTTAQRLSPVSVLSGTMASYNYGDASHKHAVTSLSSGETYTYDANGNMTQRVEGGVTYTQTFDAENRLVSVTTGGQTTQFLYDGFGNLVKKTKPDGSKTIYVGGVYEVDKTSGGSVTRTVTYYPAAGAMRINSTLYYTLKDHLGSASVVTDASGIVVGEQRYYPFGETRVTTGSMFTDKLFTGQRELAGLGLYNYGARFYSPKLGRFISADTIVPGAANPQAFNRYSYVLNNPLRYTDPTGHYQCEDAFDCRRKPVKTVKKVSPPKLPAVPKGGGTPTYPVSKITNYSYTNPQLFQVTDPYIDLATLPQRQTFHPLQGNVVAQIPIYDYSYRPPKHIGNRIVSYAYDTVTVDPKGIPSLFLPIPSVKDPVSLNNVEIAYSAGWNFTKRGLENLAGLGIVITCQICAGVAIGLKALSVVENVNDMVTIDSHIRSHDVYFTTYEFEIGNPLDQFIYQKIP